MENVIPTEVPPTRTHTHRNRDAKSPVESVRLQVKLIITSLRVVFTDSDAWNLKWRRRIFFNRGG